MRIEATGRALAPMHAVLGNMNGERYAAGGLALAALAATVAAVIGVFAVSPIALEAAGLPYFEAGGNLLSRIHPATPLALFALVLRCLAARAPARLAARLAFGDPGVVLLMAATTIAAVFAVFVDKTPVTPLVDTFVLPAAFALLLRDLDPAIARRLAVAVAVLLAANAAVAAAEVLTDWRLVPIDVPDTVTGDPTQPGATFSWQAELAEDWRARALLGHPIVNGAITGAFVLCLAAPGAGWLPPLARAGLIALSGASLFTFGARTSLVLTIVLAAALLGWGAASAVARGSRLTPSRFAAGLVCLALAVAAAAMLAHGDFFARTLQRFTADQGSATTRITMFALLEPISLSDLMLRPDKDLVATLQRLYGLEFGIESSWLGLALTYGLPVATMLLVAVLAFFRSIAASSGPGASIVLAFYFILVSVTASVSGKTTTLAMVVALILLFLRSGAPGPTTRRAGVV